MKNIRFIGAILIVGAGGYFVVSREDGYFATICPGEVRSREQSARASLGVAAKNLEEVRVELDDESSGKQLDRLAGITFTDLPAIGTCDAASLRVVTQVEQYEMETRQVLAQAREIKKIREYLWEVQTTPIADHGTQGLSIQKNIAAKKQILAARVEAMARMAEGIRTAPSSSPRR